MSNQAMNRLGQPYDVTVHLNSNDRISNYIDLITDLSDEWNSEEIIYAMLEKMCERFDHGGVDEFDNFLEEYFGLNCAS